MDLNQAGDFSPLGSRLFQTCNRKINLAGKGKNHMNLLIERTTIRLLIIGLALACFALSQRAQGVMPPPPGGYPNFTTAAGDNALQSLTAGVGNTAIGNFSLLSVTTGNTNTAVGALSLDLNTADSNTATGAAALLFNTTGTENTANGTAALEFNDSGSNNTAVGAFALSGNTTGLANVAIGDAAMLSSDGNFNTAVGLQAGNNLTTAGSAENIYIGDTAGTLDFNGNSPGDESGVIRIGSFFSGNTACYINGILANFIPQASGNTIVTINDVTGQLGWTTDFAAGKVEEQQKKIEEQQASISQLRSEMQIMVAQLKEQAAQIQKVSAQLEASRPTPQMVNNP
jgi:hypothetical protein